MSQRQVQCVVCFALFWTAAFLAGNVIAEGQPLIGVAIALLGIGGSGVTAFSWKEKP